MKGIAVKKQNDPELSELATIYFKNDVLFTYPQLFNSYIALIKQAHCLSHTSASVQTVLLYKTIHLTLIRITPMGVNKTLACMFLVGVVNHFVSFVGPYKWG